MKFSLFSTTISEARLIHLEFSQYPSGTDQINAHLVKLRTDEAGNADRRETLLGNAILEFLAAGGSQERLAEIVDCVPPDEHLPEFLEGGDDTRNRLSELLKPIPVVELP